MVNINCDNDPNRICPQKGNATEKDGVVTVWVNDDYMECCRADGQLKKVRAIIEEQIQANRGWRDGLTMQREITE